MYIASTFKPNSVKVISGFPLYLDRIIFELVTIYFQLIPGVVEKLIDESSYEEHDEEEEMENSKEHWEWCVGELKKLLSPELIRDTAVFMRCQLKPSK